MKIKVLLIVGLFTMWTDNVQASDDQSLKDMHEIMTNSMPSVLRLIVAMNISLYGIHATNWNDCAQAWVPIVSMVALNKTSLQEIFVTKQNIDVTIKTKNPRAFYRQFTNRLPVSECIKHGNQSLRFGRKIQQPMCRK